jgi:hypothetical protein
MYVHSTACYNAFPWQDFFHESLEVAMTCVGVEYVLQCCVVAPESSTATAKICVCMMKMLRFYERILFVVVPWRVRGREEATRGYLPLKFIGI